jgi:hypothetical protein
VAVSVTGGQKEDSLMTNVTDITTQVDVPLQMTMGHLCSRFVGIWGQGAGGEEVGSDLRQGGKVTEQPSHPLLLGPSEPVHSASAVERLMVTARPPWRRRKRRRRRRRMRWRRMSIQYSYFHADGGS